MMRCIFYLPYELEAHGRSARMLRPRKMIQAFKDIGYEVCVIAGFSTERRKLIKKVKRDIQAGIKYDFMYTESHTEPTLLTDPHHLPTHPFLDFDFFKFTANNGIKIGLFYCDIYWKFSTYGMELPMWKRMGALVSYRYDIREYKKYLTRLYVADLKVCDYLQEPKLTRIAQELPPGAEDIIVSTRKYSKRDFVKDPLKIFYVGGIGKQYQIIELVKAVYKTPNCDLTVCCRESEWAQEKNNFKLYMCEKIHVIHKSSDELSENYNSADVCSLLFKQDRYREMAKPFKAYEYLANEIPMLSTKGTAIGDFIEKENIGWNIRFEANAIAETLEYIIEHSDELEMKRRYCMEAKKRNLWKRRALQVVNGLSQNVKYSN